MRPRKADITTDQWNLAKADWLRVIEQRPEQIQQAFDTFRQTEPWSAAAEFGQRLIEQQAGQFVALAESGDSNRSFW